jgi:hypothetical protein
MFANYNAGELNSSWFALQSIDYALWIGTSEVDIDEWRGLQRASRAIRRERTWRKIHQFDLAGRRRRQQLPFGFPHNTRGVFESAADPNLHLLDDVHFTTAFHRLPDAAKLRPGDSSRCW